MKQDVRTQAASQSAITMRLSLATGKELKVVSINRSHIGEAGGYEPLEIPIYLNRKEQPLTINIVEA